MIITLDTTQPVTTGDIAIIRAYLDGLVAGVVEETEPKESLVVKNAEIEGTVKPRSRKKAEPKPEPQAEEPAPEPEPQAEESTPGPTLDDAVKKATELVSAGQKDAVKAALAKAGAGRVSELSGDQIATFLGEL